MSVQAYRGSFFWDQTHAAAQTYDIDVGFVPKVILARLMGPSSATDAAGAGHAMNAWGIWAGDVRRSVAHASADDQGNGTIYVRHADNALLSVPDIAGGGGADSDGDLDVVAQSSWPTTTTVRLIVDTQLAGGTLHGTGYRVMIEAIGGEIDGFVGSLQEPGATGSQAITGVGFQPSGVLLLSVGFGTSPANGVDSSVQGMISIGAGDGTRQWVMYTGGADNAGSMDTRSYGLTGEIVALGPEPAVTIDARASLLSLDADGFTLDWIERAATRYVFFLAWRVTGGARSRVDSFSTATDTTPFNGPALGFSPALALLTSVCRAASTADTPTDHAQMSAGSAVSASDRAALAVVDQDSPTTGNVGNAIEYDAVYINLSTTPAVQGLMDVATWADPIQFVMDDADPSAALVGLIAWGDAPAGHIVTSQFNRGQRPAPFAP